MTWLLAAALAVVDIESTVQARERAVLVATVTATCATCDWSVAGREAALLRLTVDGRYVAHLPLVRSGTAEYQVLLGTVEPGTHRVRATLDDERSAAHTRAGVTANFAHVETVYRTDVRYTPLSHAPFLYERPNTVGRFSDVPVFMWYELEPTERGTRYRYSVIFTNEDGGTPADRLMATWGRTTDIEYVYSVELDARGAILAHDFQGPEHEILPYRGALDAMHPRLWVVTDNNMVLDNGEDGLRYAPAPLAITLQGVSRERVMDAHPWLYALAAQELTREKKIVPNAPPRQGAIPDPRRYVYVEGCGTLAQQAITFSLKLRDQWVSSDRGVADYRIVRDGCFRAAVPLPDAAGADDIQAVRVQAFARPGHLPTGPAQFTDVNTLFMLDEHHVPTRRLLEWHGVVHLRPDNPFFDLTVK